MEFKCPKCGGSSFGSTVKDGPHHRYCHSHDCTFDWPEKDDWRYFTTNEKTFENKQEYEEIVNNLRNRQKIEFGLAPLIVQEFDDVREAEIRHEERIRISRRIRSIYLEAEIGDSWHDIRDRLIKLVDEIEEE